MSFDPPTPVPIGQCRAQISRAVCLVDPPEDPDDVGPRPCLEGSAAYVPVFEDLFDSFPKPLQRVFCSLNKIYIESRLYGTAYAGIRGDGAGRVFGAELGVRQSIVDAQLTLEEWASWKEQLSFGASPDGCACMLTKVRLRGVMRKSYRSIEF